MLELAARLILAAVLAFAAGAKLVRPAPSRRAMAAFGFATPGAQAVAWAVAVAAEVVLAIGVAAGSGRAAIAAGLLMALYGLVTIGALLRGRAGTPCGCFGAGSAISARAALRNFALAAALLALPLLA